MTSKNLLLVACAVLCLGGLGWLLFDATSGTKSARELERAAGQGAAERETADALLSEGKSSLDDASPQGAARAEQAAPEVGAAATPSATERTGTRLVGRIVDEQGRPLAGAGVRVTSTAGPEFFARPSRDGGGTPRQVYSDAAGRFEWTGGKPGTNFVRVRAEGFAPVEKQVEVPIDAKHDVGDVRLALGAILAGRVVDDVGRGVPGADLHLVDADFEFGPFGFGNREPLAKADGDGNFRIAHLACGPWKIRVGSEDHPDKTFEGNADRPGQEYANLRLELAPGTTIEGVALGVPAAHSGKVKVRAQSIDDRGGFGFGIGRRMREAEVGPDGRFRLRGLAADQRWQVQLRSATGTDTNDWFRQRTRSAWIRANSGDRGVQLRWQQDSGVTLQVVDAKTRAPLEEFELEGGQGWRVESVRDAEGRPQKKFPGGRARIGDMYPSTENGDAQVTVKAPGYADFKREGIALLAEADVDLGVIALEPKPTVVVTVLDASSNEPIADARVSLRPQRKQPDGEHRMTISVAGGGDDMEFDDGSDTRRAKTDAEGRATLTSFPGQTCTLRVEAPERAPSEVRDLALPEEGACEQRVLLSAGGSVAIQVRDAQGRPISGLRIDHRRVGASGPQMPNFGPGRGGLVTNAQGQAIARNLEVGKHRFRVSEPDGGMRFGGGAYMMAGIGGGEGGDESWSEVEVLEGQQAVLELESVTRASLTGIVREAGVPLAGASLSLKEDRGDDAGGMADLNRMRINAIGMGAGGDARSSGQGEYSLEGRKPGKYKLTVEHALRAMPSSFPIELREGANRFDVDLLLTTISGRVTNDKGEPIAGVRVKAEEHQPQSQRPRMMFAFALDDGDGETVTIGDGSAPTSSTTAADGSYSLRGVEAGVPLIVKAETKDWQPASSEPVEVAPGENREGVHLTLERGGKLEVEALDSTGKPMRMAFVTASPQGGGEPKTGVLGPGGLCTLSGLKPGSYTVNVRAMGPPGGGASNPEPQTAAVLSSETQKLTFRFE
ncbi:MAG: carboxypeptidase regulatory-like domain-containing protein [Planctomycetes bacterium]|nr:carboxypeptidase regulatory-like domain-containing protein [Planctomycetota bacterium]